MKPTNARASIPSPTQSTSLTCLSPETSLRAANMRNRLQITLAMRLLDAGVDITVIALWLGHESVETTRIYLTASLALKERALARTTPLASKPGRYQPGDQLLAFLESL